MTRIITGIALLLGFVCCEVAVAQNATGCLTGTAPSINDLKTTSPRCGSATGEVSLTATGGTSPLTYSIDGTSFQNQSLFRNLPGGNYTAYVRDAKGCESTQAVSLPVSFSVAIADVSAKPATCGQINGSLTVTATGGSGAMQYSTDGRSYQSENVLSGLKAGNYAVQIRDGAGCTATRSVSLAGGPTIDSVITTPPRCGTANGELTISATGGVGTLAYAIDETVYQTDSRFTNLPGGSYTVRVRDDSGCQLSRNINLPRSNPLILVSTTLVPTTCGLANGRATMIISGGVNPIRFSTDGRRAQTSSAFDSLRAGTYTLFAQDSAGCTAGRSVTIAASAAPTITDVTITAEDCGQKNASITVTPADPATTYTFSVDGQTFQPGTTFAGLSGGTYTVSIRDQNACVGTRPVSVAVNCANSVHVPSAFSPNADNRNDALTTHFSFPSLVVTRFVVYDRWGSVIYSRVDFAVTNGEPIWNGQLANGTTAPAGSYPYRLDCRFPDGSSTTYNQSVALVK